MLIYFLSFPPLLQISPPPTEMDPPLPAVLLPSEASVTPLVDPLVEMTDLQAGLKPVSEVFSEPSDEFVDLTNNITSSPDDPASAENSFAEAVKNTREISLEESSDEFVDLTGSESEAPIGGAVLANVTIEAAPDQSEVTNDEQTLNEQETKKPSAAPAIKLLGDLPASNTQQPQGGDKLLDPLVNLLSEAPASFSAKNPSKTAGDLFQDDGSELFAEPQQVKSAKQPQKSLFDEPDEDLFGGPLGASLKKPGSREQKSKRVLTKACGDEGNSCGPLKSKSPTEPADIFAEEGVTTASSRATSKTNGVHAQEDTDMFTGTSSDLFSDILHSDPLVMLRQPTGICLINRFAPSPVRGCLKVPLFEPTICAYLLPSALNFSLLY